MLAVRYDLIHAVRAERFLVVDAVQGNDVVMLQAALWRLALEDGGLKVYRQFHFFTITSDETFELRGLGRPMRDLSVTLRRHVPR